jgi:hypothetical protein
MEQMTSDKKSLVVYRLVLDDYLARPSLLIGLLMLQSPELEKRSSVLRLP